MTMYNPSNLDLRLTNRAGNMPTLYVILIAIILLLSKQQGSL